MRQHGLTLAALVLACQAINVFAALPKDACALLKSADIQALAPGAKPGSGKAGSIGAFGVECTYAWGPKNPQWGEPSLTVTVIDTSKAYAGRSADDIKQGLAARVKAGGSNAAQVTGVGDAAAFTHEARTFSAVVEVYIKAKDVHLAVKYHGGDALASKDKLVALAKEAAARL